MTITSRVPRFIAMAAAASTLALSACASSDMLGAEPVDNAESAATEQSTPEEFVEPHEVFAANNNSALDPRYQLGSFAAWSTDLAVNPDDYLAVRDLGGIRPASVQGWLSDDGQTAVIAMGGAYETSTLTAMNVLDGSVKWSTSLAEHRAAIPDLEGPSLMGLGRDVHCLSEVIDGHILCDNVGAISISDGSVTNFNRSVDFIGSSEGPEGALIHGILDPYERGLGAATFRVDGTEVWSSSEYTFSVAGVGPDYGVLTPAARQFDVPKVVRVVNLTDGAVLSDIPGGPGFDDSLASASTEGVVVFNLVDPGSGSYSVELYSPSGELISNLGSTTRPLGQVSLRNTHFWREAPTTQTPEELIAAFPVEGDRVRVIDGRTYSLQEDFRDGGMHVDSVGQVEPSGGDLPASAIVGAITGTDMSVTRGESSADAWNLDGSPAWQLPLPEADSKAFSLVRVGPYFVYVWHPDSSTARAKLIAPGIPSNVSSDLQLTTKYLTPDGAELPAWTDEGGADSGIGHTTATQKFS